MVNRKENTKQAILKAMVMLLKTESFDDITTVKLSKRAGISRSSFYTHYKDKYEMIDYYQQTFFHKLEYIFEKKYQNKEIQAFIINKVRLLITTDLQDKFRTEELSQTEKEYQSIYLAHAFFGVCQSWIAKGKKESPQEMTQFVLKMLTST
ncbi:TPA: TetR/AcrR family transcriptional regulator [Streptococcus pyogenes]|nr:TetR/AcrR family transcriptional regulator [Streptococcus pyogenes]HER4811304.1 TetR/AcrR family transcriptional regulator [Streptococcus pyogenes NGAS075]